MTRSTERGVEGTDSFRMSDEARPRRQRVADTIGIPHAQIEEFSEICIAFCSYRLSVRTNDESLERFLRHSFEFMVDSPSPSVNPSAIIDYRSPFPVPVELYPLIHSDITNEMVSAHPDFMWLHASAAEYQGQSIVFAGASGQGKSTFVCELCARGWKYLTDDALPLEPSEHTIQPFPQSPRRRRIADRALSPGDVQSLTRDVVSISTDSVARSKSTIAGFVFLEFRPGSSPAITRLSRGEVAAGLIGSCRNFQDHRRRAFETVTALASRVPGFALTYDDRRGAADLVARVAKDLLGPSPRTS